MDLDELLSADANALPCRLRRVGTGELMEARLESTSMQHALELGQSRWAEARFAALWPGAAQRGEALKLVLSHGEDTRIQGIMRPGKVHYRGSGLWDSLLESAPWNQWGAPEREYAGVGQQLVLRLVLEALDQEGEGSIYIHPTRGAVEFYLRLGFVQVTPGVWDQLVLHPEEAFALLRAAWGEP